MSNIPSIGIFSSGETGSVVLDAADALPPIANAPLLFQGDYARHGPDLLIGHPEHGSLTIKNYFLQSKLPALVTSEGALLEGSTVAQLAGPQASGQYAQAGAGLTGAPVGNVQTVTGTATAQRTDGTTVTLSTGDPVFQGDVVQTAGNSTLIILFVDETLFSLSADARMVLDELIYSPNGSGNSMVMSLVQGSFVFVTGQVAPTGDMRVETPTATMGIRGTTPIVQVSALDGSSRYALTADPSGLLGSFQLFDRITGQLLGTVSAADVTYFLQSPGAAPLITPRTPAEIAAVEGQVQQTFAAHAAAGLGQQNTDDDDDTDNGGAQNNPGPDQTDAGPEQIFGDPRQDLSNPELFPLGDGTGPLSNDGPEGLGEETGGTSAGRGRNSPSNNIQTPDDPNSADPIDDSSVQEAVNDDLAFVLPSNLVTQEDQSFNLSGLNVEIPGDGEGTVTIVARSTVTLAQVSGLTFLIGDGFDDEIVSFTGSEADINAALAGMTYSPTPNSEMGGLNLTVFDGNNTLEADVPITIQPVEDPPVVFDISLTVGEDGSVSAPFVGFDPDAGDTLAHYAVSQPSQGTLEVFEDGTFTFDTNGEFDSLSANATQVITFEYAAVDSTGLVSQVPATVTITVTGENDAPVAEDIALLSGHTENAGFENGYEGWNQIAGPAPGPSGEFIADLYGYSFDIDQSGTLIPGDPYVANISFSGFLNSFADGPDIGTAFGPSLESDVFTGLAGDTVVFEYRLLNGDDLSIWDDALTTAQIINQTTGEIIEGFSDVTPFRTLGEVKQVNIPINEAGDYKILFNIGSFDATDGGIIGARLAIGTAGILSSGVPAGEDREYPGSRFLENVSDAEGDPISLDGVSPTSVFGANVALVNGNVVYSTGNAFDFLVAGQTITDTFQYTVSDGYGGFDTATATVEVVGTASGAPGVPLPYAPVADQAAPSPQVHVPVTAPGTGQTVVLQEALATNTVTYAFPSATHAASGLTGYSAAQQAAAVAALTLWADFSGLAIAEAGEADTAAIRFLNSKGVDFAETFETGNGSTIVTNPDFTEIIQPDSGTYGFLALMHETGHAIGLEHAPSGLTQVESVMSTVTADELGVSWWNGNGVWVYAQTPMVEDIAAVHAAYGANPAARAGDTVYGFNSTETGSVYDFSANKDPVLTIYDANGYDTLDVSGTGAPAVIDLNPGAYSSVDGMTSNIGIAYGTVIEKAIGGAGDDLLIGSSLGDTLDGGAGLDTLIGGGGADTFVLAHDDFADIIVDFQGGEDRLDLSALLDANFVAGDVGDYLQVAQQDGGSVVSVDQDGAGNTSDFRDVAVLQSVQSGGIIDFVFSDNGVQATDTVVA